jgi:hypothetical protein
MGLVAVVILWVVLAGPSETPEELAARQQAELVTQKQECLARGIGVWNNGRCECQYECVQHYKYMRKWTREWNDAMNPWKD